LRRDRASLGDRSFLAADDGRVCPKPLGLVERALGLVEPAQRAERPRPTEFCVRVLRPLAQDRVVLNERRPWILADKGNGGEPDPILERSRIGRQAGAVRAVRCLEVAERQADDAERVPDLGVLRISAQSLFEPWTRDVVLAPARGAEPSGARAERIPGRDESGLVIAFERLVVTVRELEGKAELDPRDRTRGAEVFREPRRFVRSAPEVSREAEHSDQEAPRPHVLRMCVKVRIERHNGLLVATFVGEHHRATEHVLLGRGASGHGEKERGEDEAVHRTAWYLEWLRGFVMTMNVGTPGWHGTLLLLALASSFACGGGGDSSTSGSSSGGTGAGGGSGGTSPSGGTGAVMAMLPTCGATPDCGGDPDGTWDVTNGCLHVLANPYTRAGCEDALAAASLDASGSYTFLLDTLTFDLDLIVTHTISISDFCASATYQSPTTAANVCPNLEEDYASDPDVTEATCSVTDGRCVCEVTFVPQHALGSSPIDIQGSEIWDANGKKTDFCVEGDDLTLYFADASNPPLPGETGIELVLERR